jgi:hypothetical protein
LSGPLEKFMRWMMLSSGAGCPKRRGLLQTIFGPCLREGRAAEGVLLHEWLTCRSAGA